MSGLEAFEPEEGPGSWSEYPVSGILAFRFSVNSSILYGNQQSFR